MTIKVFLTGRPLDEGRHRPSCFDGHRILFTTACVLHTVLSRKCLQFTVVYSSTLCYSFLNFMTNSLQGAAMHVLT